MLKEAQYDDNVVGFYQSTPMGAFLRQSLISTQASHHESLRQGGIALVHGKIVEPSIIWGGRENKFTVDSSSTSRGSASLRAFKLSKSFLAAHKVGTFNSQRQDDRSHVYTQSNRDIPV